MTTTASAIDIITKEPINRMVTVSRLVQMLKEFPENSLVFVKNEAGDYSTAIF